MTATLPYWFKQAVPDILTQSLAHKFRMYGVHTVCQQARCPNTTACFKDKQATFMILGSVCTRDCSFCAVDKTSESTLAIDNDEPRRILEAVRELGLKYVVITSVTRDDLEDAGAQIFAQTIRQIRSVAQDMYVEALVPDFKGSTCSIETVLSAGPVVFAHNLETVSRLYPYVRPQGLYRRSLDVLRYAKDCDFRVVTKTSLMLGLGETEDELIAAMQDARQAKVDILTLGQYLAPSFRHHPVVRFYRPERFEYFGSIARGMGFKAVCSGPLVRSSYKAAETYTESKACMTLS